VINLSVIVPFFNEEQFLEESIDRLLSNDIYSSIYLIDNNSTDNSYNIAKNLETQHKKIELYKTNKKKGKGSALGFSRSLIKTSHVVIHDADLEYFPEDIVEMFDVAQTNQNSLILGSRFIGSKQRENIYLRTFLANKVMSLFFSFVNFYKVTDVATCYKLMPSKFFINTELRENGFSIEIELLSKFLKYNKSVLEVPIAYEGRSYSEGKKIKASDGIQYLLNTIRYRFFN
jgi:dolichol-phosphate mannosyltransferase